MLLTPSDFEFKDFDRAKTELVDICKTIKKVLGSKDIRVPFFICGGSVFSSITSTSFDDIDVFFYNKRDADLVVEKITKYKSSEYTVTKNTVTHYAKIGNKTLKIQYVNCVFGDEEYVMSTFDINTSKCCINSNYEILFSDDFSHEISVDYNNVKSSSLKRFNKYVANKNAIDKNQVAFKDFLNYLIANIYTTFESGYDGVECKGITMLRDYVMFGNSTSSNLQYIHDTICEYYTDKDKLFDIFKILLMHGVEHPCDELHVHLLIDRETFVYGGSNNLSYHDKRIREKFAEHFI